MSAAEIIIQITRPERTVTLEFESSRQMARGGPFSCEVCGMYCPDVGFLVKHIADNCSESATVGAFLRRMDSRE